MTRNALVNNELLPAVQLTFYSAHSSGERVVDYVITLTDATIVEVHHHPVAGLRDSSTDKFQLEDVSFAYRKINVADKIGNTDFSADVFGSRL